MKETYKNFDLIFCILDGKIVGSSTKFIKVQKGPFDGRCAIVDYHREEDMFRMFCRDWKVSLQKVFEKTPKIIKV